MVNEQFRHYLFNWCGEYRRALGKIQIFAEDSILTESQQRTYASAFQTFRGHFVETVLWPMQRLAKDPSVPSELRERILDGLAIPLREELGLDHKDSRPHDDLYQQFATSIGVNADAALCSLEAGPEAIRIYNRQLHGYLTGSLGRSWTDVVRGLVVYLFLERIDEFDYKLQLDFVSRFSLIRKLSDAKRRGALQFYAVHANVRDQHFEAMSNILDDLWPTHEGEIRVASSFLTELHQEMYRGLSKHVLSQIAPRSGPESRPDLFAESAESEDQFRS